jgi:hypothetical protein
MMPTPFYMPGVRQPVTVAAARARVGDDEEVVGICVQAHARAYLVRALGRMNQHVINDLLHGRPVSVTHCDRDGCTRVFTSDKEQGPLGIDLEGWSGQHMLLRTGDDVEFQFYFQDTLQNLNPSPHARAFPFQEFEFERTTWKAWKQAHPDTDIYVGRDGRDEAAK